MKLGTLPAQPTEPSALQQAGDANNQQIIDAAAFFDKLERRGRPIKVITSYGTRTTTLRRSNIKRVIY